jgi:hypothetical protein
MDLPFPKGSFASSLIIKNPSFSSYLLAKI